ncbi:unnamed protein product, partial [Urochloa humidicola]
MLLAMLKLNLLVTIALLPFVVSCGSNSFESSNSEPWAAAKGGLLPTRRLHQPLPQEGSLWERGWPASAHPCCQTTALQWEGFQWQILATTSSMA